MATQAQLTAAANLHAFGNRTDIQAEYPTETFQGAGTTYDIKHSDPYELAAMRENAANDAGLTMPVTELTQITDLAINSSTKNAVVFTYTYGGEINNVETFAVYVWSSGLQDGKWFYGKASETDTGFTVDMTSLGNGNYTATVEAEAYADGVQSIKSNEEAFILA